MHIYSPVEKLGCPVNKLNVPVKGTFGKLLPAARADLRKKEPNYSTVNRRNQEACNLE